ncbi:adenosine 5'-monophosphoramidase HINT3-like isoform X2 [Saccostrea cucullata]|uniref:adenosine 5'-monophosphoramidase HINT3-like isoform X2 n=1 Tax=Saccostrea cuccullata TaxID=36930 RepID=UPI002ED12838
MSKADNSLNRCVFCRIANLQDPNTTILFQDEEFVAFRDRSPAADHHYLIITKQHIKNPKELKAGDLEMVERLIATGEKVLENAGGKCEEARLHFTCNHHPQVWISLATFYIHKSPAFTRDGPCIVHDLSIKTNIP